MTRPEPRLPSPSEVVQSRIQAHQQRMAERRNETTLRYLAHRLRKLSQQMAAAPADANPE